MNSIYMHRNWNKLQENQEGGKAIDFEFKSDLGEISYSFIKRIAREYNGKIYYDIVSPRGETGHRMKVKHKGYEVKLVSAFDVAFQQYCDQNDIIAEFIKYDPWNDVSRYFSNVYDIEKYGKLYCIDLQKDFLNQVFSNDKRYDIRKALKSGLEVKFDELGTSIHDFIKLYKFTEIKYNLSNYYQLTDEFLAKYFELLPNKVIIANCYFDHALISSIIILLGSDIAHYHFSANDPQYKHLQGNTYLLYECMKYCKEKGMLLFDLGGATPNSALEKFKKKLVKKDNSYIYEYSIGKKIRNHKIYSVLKDKTVIENPLYFPVYRQ